MKFSLDQKRFYQTDISQRVAAVNKFNNFIIPKTKAGNEQCASTAPVVSAQLKLTGIPQSITEEIYNEAKGIIENGSVLKGYRSTNRINHNRPKQTLSDYHKRQW